MTHELTELVEEAAKARKRPAIAREFIEEALTRIDSGLEEVERYPTGKPSLSAVYEIADRLQATKLSKQ